MQKMAKIFFLKTKTIFVFEAPKDQDTSHSLSSRG